MTVSIKNGRKYKEYKEEMKEIRSQLKHIYRDAEIRKFLELKSLYRKIFRSSLSLSSKLTKLLDVLLISTSYLERVTSIKNDLSLLMSNVDKKMAILTRGIKKEDGFNKLSKKDQDSLIEVQLGVFEDVRLQIEYYIETLDNIITYLDKLGFALKSVISVLKEKINNERD